MQGLATSGLLGYGAQNPQVPLVHNLKVLYTLNSPGNSSVQAFVLPGPNLKGGTTDLQSFNTQNAQVFNDHNLRVQETKQEQDGVPQEKSTLETKPQSSDSSTHMQC